MQDSLNLPLVLITELLGDLWPPHGQACPAQQHHVLELDQFLQSVQVELVEQDGQVLGRVDGLKAEFQLLQHHRVLAVRGLRARNLEQGLGIRVDDWNRNTVSNTIFFRYA